MKKIILILTLIAGSIAVNAQNRKEILQQIQKYMDDTKGILVQKVSGVKSVLKEQIINENKVEVYETRGGDVYGKRYPVIMWNDFDDYSSSSYIGGFEDQHKELVRFSLAFGEDDVVCKWTENGKVYEDIAEASVQFYVRKKDEDKVAKLLQSLLVKK